MDKLIKDNQVQMSAERAKEYIDARIAEVANTVLDVLQDYLPADGIAEAARKLAVARLITLEGDVSGSIAFDGSANATITTTLNDIDASKITSGILDLARLPQAALERCVVVPDNSSRFALTTDQVQLGDSVKVTKTDKMYIVVDETNLDSEDGYIQYASATTIADKLASSHKIGDASFDGTKDITLEEMGVIEVIKEHKIKWEGSNV